MYRTNPINDYDPEWAMLPPRFRFVSRSRKEKPQLERLESRYFFAAHHGATLPPPPGLELPSQSPITLPVGTVIARTPSASVANILGPVQSQLAQPGGQDLRLITLLDTSSNFTLMASGTRDTLFGGQSDADDIIAMQ